MNTCLEFSFLHCRGSHIYCQCSESPNAHLSGLLNETEWVELGNNIFFSQTLHSGCGVCVVELGSYQSVFRNCRLKLSFLSHQCAHWGIGPCCSVWSLKFNLALINTAKSSESLRGQCLVFTQKSLSLSPPANKLTQDYFWSLGLLSIKHISLVRSCFNSCLKACVLLDRSLPHEHMWLSAFLLWYRRGDEKFSARAVPENAISRLDKVKEMEWKKEIHLLWAFPTPSTGLSVEYVQAYTLSSNPI